jgi:protein tyrosine phosphatase
MGMVQTIEQLEFVYTSLIDCVQELVLLDCPTAPPAV